MMTEPLVEVVAAARAVAERLADLDGHIERRAVELAAPAIAEAERSIEAARVRIPDLQREFAHQVRGLERQLENARAELLTVRQDRDHLKAEVERLERESFREATSG